MDSRSGKKEVSFIDDDQALVINSAHEQLAVAQHPSTTGVTVEIRTFVSTTPDTGISTSFIVNARHDRPRIPSLNQQIRSRSKSPPLPSAKKLDFSGYRSRSQTITQRQVSGSIPSSFGQPTGLNRHMRISSVGLTDGMKSLTLEECDDIMDFTWD